MSISKFIASELDVVPPSDSVVDHSLGRVDANCVDEGRASAWTAVPGA